jgi:L-threonylcarbamoyladenylate synthase
MATIGTDLDHAVELLVRGELVAIPTETVYGLAASAVNPFAINNIYSVKNRPKSNPLIVHIADIHQMSRYAINIPDVAYALAEKCWPGPLTLLLSKQNTLPKEVTAGNTTIALRIPNHPLTLSLLKKLPFPLVAPSANPSGYISPTKAEHVSNQLGDKIPYILNGGACSKGIESTIVGFEEGNPIIYRKGFITTEDITAITGVIKIVSIEKNSAKLPGMAFSHYAPNTPLFLVERIDERTILNADGSTAFVFLKRTDQKAASNHFFLTKEGDLSEAASNLYALLHDLDDGSFSCILVEKMPDYGIGQAINDKLERAKSKK